MSKLLRSKEVAAMLAISDRKLWELTNRGEIPCLRIGRGVRYDEADVLTWIDRLKRKGGRNGRKQG